MIEPVLAAWRFECRGRALHFGRPPEHDLRDIMDAILYVDRTGVPWRCLPHDFPHWSTVYGYFAKWADEGVFAQLNGMLRLLLPEKEGRDAEPSACVIDAQSVKTSTSVHASGQGIDAGKKIVGRKRSIVTDTLGLLLAVLVTAASVQDSVAGTRLLDQAAADHPRVRKVWVDGGYRQRLVEHAATLGIDREITAGTPGARGFTPIPKQWAVERTYGWLMLHRRLARDYETLHTPLRGRRPPCHDRPHGPPHHQREHHLLARPEVAHRTDHTGMKQRTKTTSELVLYLPRSSGLADGLEGLGAFDGFADVVAECPVFVLGAGWASGASASGFGNTGRAGEVSADAPEPRRTRAGVSRPEVEGFSQGRSRSRPSAGRP